MLRARGKQDYAEGEHDVARALLLRRCLVGYFLLRHVGGPGTHLFPVSAMGTLACLFAP